MKLNEKEQAVMDQILGVMRQIEDWGLRANQTELAMHVHGLQSFVIQRMLGRGYPESWSSWYEESE